jgi:hypothetical protein
LVDDSAAPTRTAKQYTGKKENKIFLIYKEIQKGAVAKSYMRKGVLIYEEMRKYFVIYEKALKVPSGQIGSA